MTAAGIVHFGPGAFHRAHQADFIDRLLRHDPRWGIAAVSLRSAATVEALKRQRGYYTLAILDEETSFRTLNAHRLFFGPGDGEAVRRLLREPQVSIVSSTVTEKGYCLAGDGTLDFVHPDIAHDLRQPERPLSLVGWLALGLKDRRDSGMPPFTPLCCDNMVSNGRKLRAAVLEYTARLEPALADWIAGEAVFPDTMVDSITPATMSLCGRWCDIRASTTNSRKPGGLCGLDHRGRASGRFTRFGRLRCGHGGGCRRMGKAKLRILNGAHSTLAYLGLLIGHETVSEAMGDVSLARFVERLILDDIQPSLEPSPLDLGAYAAEILQRFRNPAIRHKLSQIAWDGSQKLPYRLLDTLAEARAAGRPVERLAVPVAAWMLFVARQARGGVALVDPLAETLAQIGVGGDIDAFLGLRQVFPPRLANDPVFRGAVTSAAKNMREEGPRALLEKEFAHA